MEKKILERFFAKVQKTEGCWIWKGSRTQNGKGYGQFCIGKKHYQAHRLSWEIVNGEIPFGLWALHRCDNRSCVNPDHLFLGTQSDNICDASSKCRLGKRQKLTPALVAAIRAEYKAGNKSMVLGRKYGVNPSHIRKIIRRVWWKHVG